MGIGNDIGKNLNQNQIALHPSWLWQKTLKLLKPPLQFGKSVDIAVNLDFIMLQH
jgi:hypothetical protein